MSTCSQRSIQVAVGSAGASSGGDDYGSSFNQGGPAKASGPKESFELDDEIPF